MMMKKCKLKALLALLSVLLLCGICLFGLTGCDETKIVLGIRLNPPAGDLRYEIGDFSTEGYTVTVLYDDGTTRDMPLTLDMIPDEDRLLFYKEGKATVSVNYLNFRDTFEVEMVRREFRDISLASSTVTYDGKTHSLTLSGDIPAGTTISYPNNNSFVSAGTYTVIAVLSRENYVSKTLEATLVIERADYNLSAVVFEDTEVIYNGEKHTLAAAGTLPEGVKVSYTVKNLDTGSELESLFVVDSGSYAYTASFSSDLKNYNPIPSVTKILTVKKKTYDLSNITFNNRHVSYDGKEYSIFISGALPRGVSVSYSQSKLTEAGVYQITASFIGDQVNYNPIPPMTATLTIDKIAPVIPGKIYMDPPEDDYLFDGLDHRPAVSTALDLAEEKIEITYFLRQGNNVTSGETVKDSILPGTYTLEARLTYDGGNPNYIPLDSIFVTYSISGAVLSPTNVYYDGNPHSFALDSDVPEGFTATATYVDSSGTEYTEGTVVDIGSYTVNVEIANPTTGVFYVLTGNMTILASDMTVHYQNEASYEFNGKVPEPAVTADGVNFSDQKIAIKYSYLDSENGPASENPALPGTHWMKIELVYDGDKKCNYNLPDAFVCPYTVTVPSLVNSAVEAVYDGQPHTVAFSYTPDSALTVSFEFTDEKGNKTYGNAVNVGSYTVSAILKNETTGISYAQNATVVITQANLAAFSTVQSADRYLFNGTALHPTISTSVDLDAEQLAFVYTVRNGFDQKTGGAATDTDQPGKYTLEISLRLLSDSSNYVFEALYFNYEIAVPALKDLTFEYDGQAKAGEFEETIPAGVTVTYSYKNSDGDPVDASAVLNQGVYSVSAVLVGANDRSITVKNGSITITPKKLNYTVQRTYLGDFPFTGTHQQPTVNTSYNLSDYGITLTYSFKTWDGTPLTETVIPGYYTVEFHFAYSDPHGNYVMNKADNLSLEYAILSPKVSHQVVRNDGQAHAATLESALPTGYTVTFAYEIGGTAIAAEDVIANGTYDVTATITNGTVSFNVFGYGAVKIVGGQMPVPTIVNNSLYNVNVYNSTGKWSPYISNLSTLISAGIDVSIEYYESDYTYSVENKLYGEPSWTSGFFIVKFTLTCDAYDDSPQTYTAQYRIFDF